MKNNGKEFEFHQFKPFKQRLKPIFAWSHSICHMSLYRFVCHNQMSMSNSHVF